ncbi:hypothetical protein BOTNAR_0142g00030 [Botryotinia narcissicola]|uniref:Uncharacterized protein n=1 Tax=Botryotinia narcissicola TaxID=278944 RepID=A0A4Z1IMJ8_9HELO|nr:hypothetical protein BOTNAR_0142g00030 [Botryotinia narcissicola]
MSTYFSPNHAFSRDVGSMEEEMIYFRMIPLNHPNRRVTLQNLRRRLQELLNNLRDENASFESRIGELEVELSTYLAGGGRMLAIYANFKEEIDAELNVLRRQQQSLTSSINTVSGWCAEFDRTGQA